MADFGGSPVGTTVNPVGQGMETLSNVMNFKRQQQALQTGVYQQQSAQANAQQDQQKNQELQSLAQFTKGAAQDPKYHNPDGSLNVQKYQTDAMAAAPTYGQLYIGQMTSNANAMVDNRKALLGLSNEQRKTIGGYFGAVAAKPNATKDDLMDAAEQARAVSDDPQYQRSVDRMLMATPDVRTMPTEQASAALRQHARGIAVETGAPDASTSEPTKDTMQGPNGLQGVNLNPMAPGGVGPQGPAQPQGVAPGAQVVKDAYDNQYTFDPQTNRVTLIGAGKGAAHGATGSAGFKQPVAGQQQVQQDVDVARKAGDAGGQVRAINDKLLNLSEQTRTGPGAQSVQKIAAAVGLPSGSNYQEINAYLERQAATAGQAMGLPNTNAGLHAAQQASGTAEYTPQALQEKVKFADALNSGAMAYRQGLDKLVGTGATPDYSKYQAFRSAWAQNFSPDVFRAEDALRRGDKKELEAIKSELGSRGMAEMKKRADNLRALENGQIPQ